MTKEQLEEALKKEIEEISKEFPFVKDGYAGYGEYCMMELARGICRRLGLGSFAPYDEYVDQKTKDFVKKLQND